MPNTDNIVTQVRRKNTSGFDAPFFIGSSAKYVTGVRGSNVNNIEENFLLGTDCITTKEELSNGTIHTIIEYRDDNTDSNYYILESYQYQSDDFIFDTHYFTSTGETFKIPNDASDNIYQNETLIGVDINAYSFSNDDETLVAVNNIPVACEQTLKFVNDEGTLVIVARKYIYSKYYADGGKVIQKQVIQNLL